VIAGKNHPPKAAPHFIHLGGDLTGNATTMFGFTIVRRLEVQLVHRRIQEGSAWRGCVPGSWSR
jgi:hypothetical protein